jgi:hypothetical protein
LPTPAPPRTTTAKAVPPKHAAPPPRAQKTPVKTPPGYEDLAGNPYE